MDEQDKPLPRTNSFRTLKLLIRILLPLLFIAAGAAGWTHFKQSAPKMKKKRPKPRPPVVETVKVFPKHHQQVIQVMGTVKPDQTLSLKSRVAGEVIWISPKLEQGGLLKKGDLLLTIDPTDYKIARKKAQSALDKALADLAIEQGNQSIAREALRMINEAANENIQATDLSLRKPQLMAAQAAVDNARADLEQARLNQDRTRVFSPFNALVLEENLSVSSRVSTQETLATLVDYDRFKVEALVPLDLLNAIDLETDSCCRALIRSQSGTNTWEGLVHGSTGKINEKSRMAGMIIKVNDPLNLLNGADHPLMLNDYVHVDIFGRSLKDVYALPRLALREGDTVWVYQNGLLDIRNVSIRFKEKQTLYVSTGLNPGDEIVITDLPIPVSGMALRRPGEQS
ncbi:MAG: efflux RND transporter periplasmic adaptor subunit [Desulfobacteraceae bacterium]|nr:MAG: efflux RND transporter periplasmic adaptor subunit [Desulfobacteraceae bacterium]